MLACPRRTRRWSSASGSVGAEAGLTVGRVLARGWSARTHVGTDLTTGFAGLHPVGALDAELREGRLGDTRCTRYRRPRGCSSLRLPGARRPRTSSTSGAGHVDLDALAERWSRGGLAGEAPDVFETEPLPADHPLWTRPDVPRTRTSPASARMPTNAASLYFLRTSGCSSRARELINVVDKYPLVLRREPGGRRDQQRLTTTAETVRQGMVEVLPLEQALQSRDLVTERWALTPVQGTHGPFERAARERADEPDRVVVAPPKGARGTGATFRQVVRSPLMLLDVSRRRPSRSRARLVEIGRPWIAVGRCRWGRARTRAGRLRGMDLSDRSHVSTLPDRDSGWKRPQWAPHRRLPPGGSVLQAEGTQPGCTSSLRVPPETSAPA